MPNINTTNLINGQEIVSSVYPSGQVFNDPPYDRPRLYTTVIRTGATGLPGYHGRIAQGKHPGMGALSYHKTITMYPQGHRISMWSGIKTTGRGFFPFWNDGRTPITLVSFDSAERAKLDDQIRTEVRLEMKDQKINIAVAAAEWNKTADMVATTATAIYNAYRDLKRGNIAGAARGLGITAPKRARRRFNRSYARNQQDALASGWLELQYGWKPLLSDVYGAAEHAAKMTVPVFEGKVQKSKTLEKTTSKISDVGGDRSVFQHTENRTSSLTIKYTVHYRVVGNVTSNAAALGLTNPAMVAWELVPFSFVVDWFLPIGDALASLDATLGLSFNFGCVTVVEKLRAQVQRSGGTQGNSENSSWATEHFRCDRVILTDFPRPATPTFKNPFSVSHALSAISLLNQFRK